MATADTSRPRVSVLMPAYNHRRFIKQAVESVAAQQVDFPIELVFADDCSPDGTLDVVREMAPRLPFHVEFLSRPANLGSTPNIMDAWRHCRGQYIALLEGDDYWLDPAKLVRQVRAMDEHPEWSMSFHRSYEIGRLGHWGLGAIVPKEDFPEGLKLERLLLGNPIPTASSMFRAGIVPELPDLVKPFLFLDWFLHILHAERGLIGFLPEAMSVYRIHAGGIWSQRPQAWRVKHACGAWDALDHYFAGRFSETIRRAKDNETLRYAEALDAIHQSPSYFWGRAITYPFRAWRRLLPRRFRD